MLPPFQNEPLTDFTRSDQQMAFRAALERARAAIGRSYPLVIDGESIFLDERFPSVNPSCPHEALGYFSNGTAAHADQAIEAAARAFQSWQYVSAAERARYLLNAAAAMRRRKHEFSAVMVLEAGKPWAEADADTAEAIDFLEYYARQAVRIADSSAALHHSPGEELGLYYIPLGVGAVISPWNFPCAIATGMVGAALAAGNTVVFKPAEQTPWIAYMMCELFWQNGLPRGVLNFLTGPGEIVGARMVEHPQTRFISFTGSREVGTQISAVAGQVRPGQKWLKRAILEMGGKDAIIVDETADLDAAASGIVTSAFGFQGQKCSACSRAILVDAIYDQMAERIAALTGQLVIDGPERGPEVNFGPVIDPDAVAKILRYIEIGGGEGRRLAGGGAIERPDGGYFIQPTIFGDVDSKARIAQDEIFGPVLALIRARDYDEALAIANDTDYGLTGAVYSRDRARLERARREFHVGNLYFNRKCTGALVGVNPFGGFNMSGTDSKAGGPDYLLLFTQAKSVADRL